MKYTLREAVAVAVKCAREYDKKLANTSILIIYRDRQDNMIKHLIIQFRPSNFQHLTGLLLKDQNGTILENRSILFYHKCIQNALKIDEVDFKPDNTTPLKLEALPRLMDLTKITRITGDYDNARLYLEAEKVVGGINYCLAISADENGFYYPKSALLEDIRNLTNNSSQVLSIFQKTNAETSFHKIRYVAKGLNIQNLKLPNEIKSIITLDYKF